MDPADEKAEPSGTGEPSSSSSSTQQPSPAAKDDRSSPPPQPHAPPPAAGMPSRYESQKRRDWNTFLQFLRNRDPPVTLPRCGGAHVIEFLNYLDQFGKTKVHEQGCSYFGDPNPPGSCACPLRQAWGSLDSLIGRLRAAHEETGGRPESNPFAARAVRIHLREVREAQAKARGIPLEKKKRKRAKAEDPGPSASGSGSGSGV